METSFQLRSVAAISPACRSIPANRLAQGWPTQSAQDEVAFENSRAFTTALQETPAVRDEVVRRAAELVGDVNYPPSDTIRMISHLLAIRMQSDSEAT